MRAIKKTIDGALGSRGAWLLEPYTDMRRPAPASKTAPVEPRSKTTARSWPSSNGYQLCVHAIGDRANRETLNIYEATFKANPDTKDLRWRVEHAQHLSAADIPRFGQLGRDRVDAGHPRHVRRAVRAARGSAPSAPKRAPTSGRS